MKYKAILRPSFKKCPFAPLSQLEGTCFSCVPESTSSDLMRLRIVRVQMKNFIKSRLIKANAVCHLTLAILIQLNCNESEIYVVVVLLLTAL